MAQSIIQSAKLYGNADASYKGASIISREELELIPAPAPTRTWFPVRHGVVAGEVENRIIESGFTIASSAYQVTSDRARMFGTLDLASTLADGVTLSVGIRNSNDQTFPISFAAGSRVFVCANLSFQAELIVSRKHTRFGGERFNQALSFAVRQLQQFREVEARRIGLMQTHELSADRADALILRAYESDVIGARTLPLVVKEWRTPSHEEFAPRTAWSLLNAFTEALKPRLNRPAEYAQSTIKLQGLLCSDARYNVPV
jgi:hypothetical protein